MQDISQQKRRASDLLAEAAALPGNGAEAKLILELLKDILIRLENMERMHSDISSAFPKNDLDYPDFDGHRRDHVHRMKVAEVMDRYKEDATKSVLSLVAVFLAGLMASGALTWLQAHLSRGTP